MLTPAIYSREQVARSFLTFASHCLPGSPLYADLAQRIAADAELLDLAGRTRPGQPPANMLLAAAHELLLRGLQHPLAAYYPSVGGTGRPGPAAFAAFRELCLAHSEAIEILLASRLTQTNETRRCAYLLPAFATVQADAGGLPLALIEVGPSAGLNLNFDRYAYDYGDGQLRGAIGSPVRISSELRGSGRPPLPDAPPAVAWRVGIDLNPVDLDNAAQVRWLEALIWPEHTERVARLRAAVALARVERPPIVCGDALELLPELIAAAPSGAALCVYHTHVTYQFSPAMRERLAHILAAASATRPIYHLGCEGYGAEQPRLTLTSYQAGQARERLLAVVTGHANWIEWHDRS